MRLRATALTPLACGLAVLVLPALLSAQTPAGRLITTARVQIEDLNNDSAAVLLRQALEPRLNATSAERLRAFILLGIAELTEHQTQAREAFRQALLLDPTARVDSLRDLASDLVTVFDAERTRVLAIRLEAPVDTELSVGGGHLPLVARPTRRARVLLTIAGSNGSVVHSDSQLVVGSATFDWDLRLPDGSPVAPGAYTLRLSARDSVSEAVPVGRTLTIELVPVDTQPLPPPLAPSAFAPETARVRAHQPAALLGGVVFGAAAGALCCVFKQEGGTDRRAFAVAGTLTLGGIIGFASGRYVRRPVAENVERNRQVRERDAQTRAAITQANTRARQHARMRLRLTGTPR